uniref:Exostosin GT47 domain-containing protein n=1 Tax=Haptolina ericina TaxID=156174 RepID=A0A7S3C229_9EUKA
MGCVPVVVQHDGEHEPVAQAFEHDLLNWDEFAVIVKHEQIDSLPQLLARTDLKAKQAGLARVWTRMVWKQWLPESVRKHLPGPDAFETTMQILLARKRLERHGV